MPVLNGAIAASPIGKTLSPALVTSLDDYTVDYWPVHQANGPALIGGALTSNVPVSTTPTVLAGATATTYGTDFFRHFAFDPQVLDLGFVSAEVTFTAKLWNKNLNTATLTSVTAANAEGVTVSLTAGAVFSPFQERTFTVTATPDGPALVAATFTFLFDVDGETVSVDYEVAGIRARLWKFYPNWADNYVTSYAYKTEEFVSRSGKEQRRALRHNPRFASEFTITPMRGKLSQFDTIMAGWQNRPFVMPDYTEYVELASSASAATHEIVVSEAQEWVHVGANIVLDDGTLDLHVITEVTGTTLTVAPVLNRDWAAGTRVYLGYPGYISSTITADNITNMVGNAKIRFEALPATTVRPEPPVAASTHNGFELFLKKPNWAGAPQVEFSMPVESVDYDRGTNAFYRLIDFSFRSVKATYLGRTRNEVRAIRQFFDRMRGRQGEFYAPTWKPDMEIAGNVSAGAFDITVSGTDVFDYLNGDTVYRRIALVKNDGTILYRTISTMSSVAGSTVLTCTSSWPAVNASDVLMICWLPRWTLASDILTVTWITDSVAQVSITMRTVEDLSV